MTRREWKIQAAAHLAGGDSPHLEASMLLCHVLGIDKAKIYAHGEEEIPPLAEHTLNTLLSRRILGEPMAYILGKKEFYGRDFLVNEHTLIPRPETEHLIDAALAYFPKHREIRFIDLGTGTGCLAITLALERPMWRGTAIDISQNALSMAKANAKRLGANIAFLQADFTKPLPFLKCGALQTENTDAGSFDLVLSNPPYISEEEYAMLDTDVRNFEPRSALVPGPTGLEHLSAIEAAACALLKGGGLLLMEHGCLQGEACRALCLGAYWMDVHTGRDLAGKDRFLSAVRVRP